MKISQLVSVASAFFASGALAHSWVECIDTEVDLDYYMKNPSKMNDWFVLPDSPSSPAILTTSILQGRKVPRLPPQPPRPP